MDSEVKYPNGEICIIVWQLSDADQLWDEIPERISEALQTHEGIVKSVRDIVQFSPVPFLINI